MNVTLEEAKSKFFTILLSDEVPIFEDILNEIKENGINIDYVITHTSPSFAFKSDKNGIEYWLKIDDALDNDLNNERSIIDKLYEKLVTDGHIIKKLGIWTFFTNIMMKL